MIYRMLNKLDKWIIVHQFKNQIRFVCNVSKALKCCLIQQSVFSACQCGCVQIYHILHILHHAAHLSGPGLLLRPASALFTGCQRFGL